VHPGGTQPLAEPAALPEPPSRVLTVPNALSVARLIGVPFFFWLVVGGPRTFTSDGWAVFLLFAAGATDWLDGKIARALNQFSKLGAQLDPAADRCYIVATLFALAIREIIPWWLVGLLVVRELVLGVALLRLRAAGWEPLQVSFAGKAATMCLMYAFPLLLLGAHAGTVAEIARIAGWSMGIWGTALYWIAAGLYLTQTARLLRAGRPDQAGPDRGGAPPG
jgi:cardiolipin synthase